MTFISARNAIQNEFGTAWTLAQPTIPVVYDNLETPPQGGAFVRLAVANSDSQQTALGDGARRWRQFGQVVVGVFVPKGTGPKLTDELVDSITAILRSKTIGGFVVTRSPSPQSPMEQGAWWVTNVLTDFYWDDAE